MKSQRSYLVKKNVSQKVYEGTIPESFFNISVFFTDKICQKSNIDLPKDVINKFKKIRMFYYKDNGSTQFLNKQFILIPKV